jgi:fibronectin type 3 domain-containing protein
MHLLLWPPSWGAQTVEASEVPLPGKGRWVVPAAERHDCQLGAAARRRAAGNLAPGGRAALPGRWRRFAALPALVTVVLALLPLALVTPTAFAATPLNVFVGYMDTHSSGSSSNQPSPWPYTDPSSFVGSPCPNFPNDTTCWDASALRLDNPGSTDVTGVDLSVVVGGSTYHLWGTSLTVKAGGTLVLTETGVQNSTNFDASDYSPNAYNGGLTASCVNSGAIPAVHIVIAGATTAYLDSAQVLNGGGVDKGHCVNGSFVSARLDESHPWAQIGSGTTSSPTAPQSLAATAGSGSVALSWSAPVSDGGAAITGYNVYRGTTSGGESATPVATNVSTRSFTDAGLTNGTTYYYKVAAVNAVGTSPQSAQAIAMPQLVQATVPAAPAGLVALGGSSSVGLSWSTPVSDGGSAITGYNVFRGTTAGGESATAVATNVKATSFTDTGLTNATTYYYKVAAVNAVGTSPSSGEASATPQATAPSAPLTLVASGGNASVALSWSAPTTDGGSGLTGYNVYRGTSAGGESATAVATNVIVTSFTDTAVTNGATYYYKVAAVNAVGTSPQSNEANATPQQAATVASAPLTLTASSGNATAGLSWSVPASNGGSPITGYNLYRGTTAGGESATAVATNVKATSFTDTGLTNATTYYYKVAAVNAVGTSPSSGEASATPQATAPSAPLTLVASGGNATAGLSWSVPASNGGSPITGYNLYRGTTAGGESTTAVATNVALTSFSDTGLTNGATYYYKVAAVNAVGTSPQSNEASATAQVASTAGFVRRVGSATATGSRTSTVLAVGAPGVVVGHTLVVSLLLSSTSSTTGAVAAADNAGNTYAVVRDVNDGSAGDRTVTLVALSVKALAVGATITATYPSSAETHLSADEFAGVTAVDTSAGATASTAAFSSGATATTGQSAEILIGTLGAESGSALGWAAGWTALPTLAISSDYLDTAYRLVTTTGTFAATGTTGGQWMASIITLKTG